MIRNTKGTIIDPMQLERINEHPIQIEDGLIPIDNLEEGILKLFEPTGGPVNMQQLFIQENNCTNAVLIAKITINDVNQTNDIVIDKISCCYGFEKLAYPMIDQVVAFGKFYETVQAIRISEAERENWFLHAGGVLADFHKKDGYYKYQIR